MQKIYETIVKIKSSQFFPLPQNLENEDSIAKNIVTVENAYIRISQLFSINILAAKKLASVILTGYHIFSLTKDKKKKNYIIAKISNLFSPSPINLFSDLIQPDLLKKKTFFTDGDYSFFQDSIGKNGDDFFDSFSSKNNILSIGYSNESITCYRSKNKIKENELAVCRKRNCLNTAMSNGYIWTV